MFSWSWAWMKKEPDQAKKSDRVWQNVQICPTKKVTSVVWFIVISSKSSFWNGFKFSSFEYYFCIKRNIALVEVISGTLKWSNGQRAKWWKWETSVNCKKNWHWMRWITITKWKFIVLKLFHLVESLSNSLHNYVDTQNPPNIYRSTHQKFSMLKTRLWELESMWLDRTMVVITLMMQIITITVAVAAD